MTTCAPTRASIVVTNHDYGRYVAAAVESGLAQHGGGVEVVVVDDGSEDDSHDVLQRFGSRIVLIEQPNGGQGAAFNTGVAAATGPIVVLLDADDVLAADLVDRLETAFADESVARVQFPLSLIDGDGASIEGSMPPSGVQLAGGDLRDALTSHPDDIVWQPTSGNAFRHDVLDRILPMPTEDYRICADYYVSNLTAAHGRVAVLPAAGGSYRIHDRNAHHRQRWTLDDVRSNIVRTTITHRHLIDECRRLGLRGLPDDPEDVRSVTALAHRVVSLRLAPERHPIGADTRSRLRRLGIAAARGRHDVSVARRLAFAAWFVLATTIPRRWVRRVARPLLEVT